MRRPSSLARERPVAAVLALTAVALLLRLVALGERTMHWDEARVAYWTLRHVRGAEFVYRPVIHGPFVPLVVAPLFDLLGPSSFAARLPVALIGGATPLAALLFRRVETGESDGNRSQGGLTGTETVALAALLAVLPGFVYYSRFMRSDVPLAAFFLVAVGFGFRAVTTGRRRDVVAAGLFVGFALPTKENVLLYLACAVGAAGVAVCWPAVATSRRTERAQSLRAALRTSLARARATVRHHLPGVPIAFLVALVPVVVFFAPRGPASDPTLGAALAGEVPWPALVERATVGTWETFRTSLWADTASGPYHTYTAKLVGLLLAAALPAVVGAGVALVDELRSPERPLVVPFVAWGVAAVLGYPLATDIPAPWISLHIALPLLVPAAVGWVALADRGWLAPRRWLDTGWWDKRGNYRGYVLAGLVVLSALHVPIGLAVSAVTPPLYVNALAQSAQPADDLDPLAATVDDAADDGGVLFYGETYYLPNESIDDRPPRPGDDWLGWWVDRLPMAWYVAQASAPSAYAQTATAVRERDSVPPVVFVDPSESGEVAPLLRERGYQRTAYDLGLYHEQAVVVFVETERLDGPEAGEALEAAVLATSATVLPADHCLQAWHSRTRADSND
ncbi:MAG: flippase activity-associated protein Agl23 [Halolamina sp.]